MGLDTDDGQTLRVPGATQSAHASSREESPGWKAWRRAVGTKIGRFPVLELLGQGGKGVVYAGYDDRLDRRVALKVLHPSLDAASEEDLWREAQAMAGVSHPNVVTVHEVGRADGAVFVVMEFIPGQTLTRWLQPGRAPNDVLEAFAQAGRGLAAAHALGRVHRDFKPGNAMRAHSGEVKVLDFGLAQVAAGEPSVAPASSAEGTLPYMAPEQHEGGVVDARSDQYSYCVSLWAGLTGRLPFGARESQAVLRAKLQGPPPWPKDAPAVPARVVAAIRRGLAAEPRARWPSMHALLAQLQFDPRRQLRRWSMGLAGTAVVGLGGFTAQAWADQHAQRCSGGQAKLAGIWDHARRAQAQAAVLGVDKPFAAAAWARTEPVLTEYARAWVGQHTAACRAATVRREETVELMDARMQCLARARLTLDATVDTLAAADAKVVQRMDAVVAGLRPLEWCEDENIVTTEVEPPMPHEAEAVANGRKALARVVSERAAGRLDAASRAMDAVTASLADVTYGPVRVEQAIEQGYAHWDLGRLDAAEASFTEALTLATKHGLRRSTFDAALGLFELLGLEWHSRESMVYWPVLEGFSRHDDVLNASARGILAHVYDKRREYTQAERELREVRAILERTLGPEHPKVAKVRVLLGNVLEHQGRYADAEAELRTAIRLKEKAVGPDHPEFGGARSALGAVLNRQARYAEAEVEHRATLQIYAKTLGPTHGAVIKVRNKLGADLLGQGKFEEAEAEFRFALNLQEDLLGAEHPSVAISRNNLAVLFEIQKRYDEAAAEHRVVKRIREKKFGSRYPGVAMSRHNLGTVLRAQGKYAEAEAELQAALAIWEPMYAPDHPHLEAVRLNLTDVKLQQGDFDAALELAETNWEVLQRPDGSAEKRGRGAFLLARLLWSVEGRARDRTRARAMAHRAAQAYASDRRNRTRELEQIRTWLDTHPA